MIPPCSDLISFADGELDPARAEAFRVHLQTCDACSSGLVEAMQLDARLSMLSPGAEDASIAAPNTLPSTIAGTDAATDSQKSRSSWKRRLALRGGPALAAAAAIAILFVHRPPTAPVPEPPDAIAQQKTRPLDIRFAYAGATSHRPRADELLGEGRFPRERISYGALDAFQRRGDRYALAIAQAWNGEKPVDVAAQLASLSPQTPSVRSDHAAVELLASDNDNIEPVLAELDALRGDRDLAAARAARWNYAILLARLELPLSAAQAFRAIAAEREPGWSDEARARAEAQDQLGTGTRLRWDSANAAGRAFVLTGAALPPGTVEKYPGLMRAHFYNAVRVAATRERVLALSSLAAELDRRGDKPVLGAYVQRIARSDFRRRAPLARAYRQLLAGETIGASVQAELTHANAPAEVADIVMGAIDRLGAIADHLDAFRQLAKQAGDPWFEILLARAEADADQRRGDWLGAETRLRTAQKLCGPAVEYRCMDIAIALGHVYQDLHRVPEALAVLRDGLRTARSSGEWGHYQGLLFRLADVERFNSSIATARAYAGEVLLTAPEPGDYHSGAELILVGAAIRGLDGVAARRALEQALRGMSPDIAAANDLADIGRLDPQPGDLARLQGWLRELGTAATLAPAQRVLADEIEGRLLIESDRAAGAALLDRAIAAAGPAPRDAIAARARAGAYSVLDFDAASSADYARVLSLTAAQFGLPAPGACSVAMAAEDERAVIAVRGSDGQDRGLYVPRARQRDLVLTVPPELARGLEACPHVGVMAQAALQGQPHILPAKLPWSYVTGAHQHSRSATDTQKAAAVIVTNVTPPAYLKLATLSPWALAAAPPLDTLSGPAATPARVLAEIRDATEIQFHTHALVDAGISDASHLVLSPGVDGRYALTAEAIRGIELRGRPIVVLAACHSAQGARYQHAAWSLPDAFLAVGARAVFAAGAAIPDLEAGPVFTRILDQIRAGAEPARALRDERATAVAADPSSWIADIILFE